MRGSKQKGNNSLYFKVFICFFIISFIICIGRSFVAKMVLETILQNRLGVKLSITGVDLNLTHKTMVLKDIVVDNPNGFPGTLAKFPKIKVYCDPYSFIKFTPKYRKIELQISEFSIVKKWNEELNTEAVKVLANQKAKSKPVKNNPLINVMTLTVDSVKYIDYSQKEPAIQKVHLGLRQAKNYNLGSLNELVQVVISEIEHKVERGSK